MQVNQPYHMIISFRLYSSCFRFIFCKTNLKNVLTFQRFALLGSNIITSSSKLLPVIPLLRKMSFPRLINVIQRQATSGNKLSTLLQIFPSCSPNTTTTRGCYLNQFDPPYLESLKPKIPIYDTVNVQIKGHDFAVLENYQKLIHQIAKVMDLDVEDGWATPAKILKVQKYKPMSSVVDSEYILPIYERNLQIVELSSTSASIFLEMVQTALPQGVTMSMHEHEPIHSEIRYVPDYDLKELKDQLDNFGSTKKSDKKK